MLSNIARKAPLIAAIATALAIVACSHPAVQAPDGPSNDRNDQEAPTDPDNPAGDSPQGGESYDFSAELSDPTPRFTSSNLSISYTDGGVIASVSANNRVIALHDLNTGAHVSLTIPYSSQPLTTGPLRGAALSVNGQDIPLDTCAIEAATDQGFWVSMRPDSKFNTDPYWTLVVTP